MMAVLKSLLDNFNVCVALELASVDSLCSLKLRFLWYLVFWVIFSCILDILSVML